MAAPAVISSGEWQSDTNLTDCRAEWLTDVLVERATWSKSAPDVTLDIAERRIRIGGASFVWLRFWFRGDSYLLEKYYDPVHRSIGIFAPVCMPFQQRGKSLITQNLLLSLWFDLDGRVTVLGETSFDHAVAKGNVSPVEAEQAEMRIRHLTLAVGKSTFPPAFVRNFTIAAE